MMLSDLDLGSVLEVIWAWRWPRLQHVVRKYTRANYLSNCVITARTCSAPVAISVSQQVNHTCGPHLWNSLPSQLRQSDSLREFKRSLKTHLFGDHTTLRLISQESRLEIVLLTYLLSVCEMRRVVKCPTRRRRKS